MVSHSSRKFWKPRGAGSSPGPVGILIGRRREGFDRSPTGPAASLGVAAKAALDAAAGGADRRSALERGQADESIARSAPPDAAAPLPRGSPVMLSLLVER